MQEFLPEDCPVSLSQAKVREYFAKSIEYPEGL
jgi:hypothetical protein